MSIQVLSGRARHDDDVGLGLRQIVESDRLLLAHVIGAVEWLCERGAHAEDDGGVAVALWLPSDEETVEEFNAVVRAEDASVDELVISDAIHPPQGERWRLHGCRHDTRP